MIYQTSIEGITPRMLDGFFVNWGNPPSSDSHLRILQGSYKIVLAIDETTNQVVGFINAISDVVLSAYIPLLEVLPSYQKRGIGKELLNRMMCELSDFYMVDLLCDRTLQPFYERLGMRTADGMLKRNYTFQCGRNN